MPGVLAKPCCSPRQALARGLLLLSVAYKCWGKGRLSFQRAFQTAAECTRLWKHAWSQLTGWCWGGRNLPSKQL